MHAADKIEQLHRFPRFYCRNNEIERQLQDQYINELRQQVRFRLIVCPNLAEIILLLFHLLFNILISFFTVIIFDQVSLLMTNLESLPVSRGSEKSYPLRFTRLPTSAMSMLDQASEDDNTLSKSDVQLSFTLEVRRSILVLIRGSSTLFLPHFRWSSLRCKAWSPSLTIKSSTAPWKWRAAKNFRLTKQKHLNQCMYFSRCQI